MARAVLLLCLSLILLSLGQVLEGLDPKVRVQGTPIEQGQELAPFPSFRGDGPRPRAVLANPEPKILGRGIIIKPARRELLIKPGGLVKRGPITPRLAAISVRVRPDLKITKENLSSLHRYQLFVTPSAPAVQRLAQGVQSMEEAYFQAVRWVWVSDLVLHGVEERWLYPREFLTQTPAHPRNPARGRPASDCEEQAYTLVSVLRALGVPAENVRVVVGKVRFGDRVGGHAWVEVFIDYQWFQLEPTSGPYWDEERERLVEREGLPFNHFRVHPYPSLEVWACFNDGYYLNVLTGEGNAPSHWLLGKPEREGRGLRSTALYAFTSAAGLGLICQLTLGEKTRKKRMINPAFLTQTNHYFSGVG